MSDRLDISRCTDRVRQLLVAAKEIAINRNEEPATIHVLQALCAAEYPSVARTALERVGFTPAAMVADCTLLPGRLAPIDILVQHSIASAKSLGHNYVGTEHLLLGLLRADDAASMFLGTQGVTLDSVTQVIRDLLPSNSRGGPRHPSFFANDCTS